MIIKQIELNVSKENISENIIKNYFELKNLEDYLIKKNNYPIIVNLITNNLSKIYSDKILFNITNLINEIENKYETNNNVYTHFIYLEKNGLLSSYFVVINEIKEIINIINRYAIPEVIDFCNNKTGI